MQSSHVLEAEDQPPQIRANFAQSHLDHLLKLELKGFEVQHRLTGIVASMGPATNDVEVMEKMLSAGMNIALLNMTFGTREEHIETIKNLREACKLYSESIGRTYPLGIAALLSGGKIRTGNLADVYGETVELKPDDVVKLTTDETYKERCSKYTVYVDYSNLAEQLKKGDMVLLDNETIMLKVEIISSTTVTCKVVRGGLLGSSRDVFVPNVPLEMPCFSEKDALDIEILVKQQIDIVIVPFVKSGSNIVELKQLLGPKGKKVAIVAQIQTLEGYKNIDEILTIANGIVISRQELGSDITAKRLVVAQKNMIARANLAAVPVIISSQILSNMRDAKLPLRSELLDISNCILDGADSLVLSSETAIGEYPVEVVECLHNACREAETCVWSTQFLRDMIDKTPMPCDQATATSLAAVLASQKLMAAAIIVITSTGKSAQIVAKYRPRCPIIAVTRYPIIARQLQMWRGIMPMIYEDAAELDWHTDLDKRVNFCLKWSLQSGWIKEGGPIVIVSGWKQGSGSTNTMKVVYAGGNY